LWRKGRTRGMDRWKANMLAPAMTAACNSRRRTLVGREGWWQSGRHVGKGIKLRPHTHTHTYSQTTRDIIEGEGCVFHEKPTQTHTHTQKEDDIL